MSSYCSEWMVINESEDEKSENSKKSAVSRFSKISETLQNEELVDVQELMQKLKIEESKNLSLSQENLSLRAQNDQLNDLNWLWVAISHPLNPLELLVFLRHQQYLHPPHFFVGQTSSKV